MSTPETNRSLETRRSSRKTQVTPTPTEVTIPNTPIIYDEPTALDDVALILLQSMLPEVIKNWKTVETNELLPDLNDDEPRISSDLQSVNPDIGMYQQDFIGKHIRWLSVPVFRISAFSELVARLVLG